jgi:hypothetical protein
MSDVSQGNVRLKHLRRRQQAAPDERTLKALSLKGTAKPSHLEFHRDVRNVLTKMIGGNHE